MVTFWPIYVNERAKRPLSTNFKGTSCGTFFSCQGDDCNDEVCVFEGFKETKVLLPEVLVVINKLLEGANKENEDIPPQKKNWKKCNMSYKPLHKH